MARRSKSPRRFLERCGLRGTYREPAQVVDFRDLAILQPTLRAPKPLPELRSRENGEPIPDRVKQTGEWPEQG